MTALKNITVVGAGTMGHGLAQVFAQGGYEVFLHDLRDEILAKARRLIASNLSTLVEAGALAPADPPAIQTRIRATTDLQEACSGADLVIEAITEDKTAKRDLFERLDRLSPPAAILASNTSYLDIFSFVETGRPEKVLITHWFAPPHLIPLVEIVRGALTSSETVEAVESLLLSLGKRPVVISRFLPGFIANRLQRAMTNEALYLLDNGYATAGEIDLVARASFGLRMPFMGPFQRMDYAGLDLTRKALVDADYPPSPLARRSETVERLVQEGRLGVKSGAGHYDYGGRSPEEVMKERDLKLLRLLHFLREEGGFD